MEIDEALRVIILGFVTEAQDLVEVVIRRLLELEQGRGDTNPDIAAAWEEAARGLHTLKGGAGSLGMGELGRLAHRMEDLLAPYRDARETMPAPAVDAVLKGLDAFMAGVRATAAGGPVPDLSAPLEAIAVQLSLVRELRASSVVVRTHAPAPVAAPRGVSAEPEAPAGGAGEPDAADPGALQDRTARDGAAGDRAWRVRPADVLALVAEVDRLREVRLRLDERRREIAAIEASKDDRIGSHRSTLFAIGRLLKSEVEEVGLVVDAIEERVRVLGAQPVRTILEPLRRIVRDQCRAAGKLAKLSVVGEDISLDRGLLQGLRESLVHMIRNAIDHGVEPPDGRERAGKHREGALTLRVEQHGNILYVEFSDDGVGLDLDRLRAVAVERGALQAAEAGALDPKFVAQMIFGSGMSTSTTVTETSGRGVGLDAVRSWAQSLKGHVDVHSAPGQGTRFTFTLPLELGSSPLLAVRAGDQQFGIPLASVERVVPATQTSVLFQRGVLELRYGERRLPLRDLGTALALRQPSLPVPGQPILVIQAQGTRCGLAVDDVVGDVDLVIRALPPEIAGIAALQGAATTSRGELLLVLRPTWLVTAAAEIVPRAVALRRALVVDDSLTARAVHRAMLEAGGYVVHAVGSAPQALEWMLRGPYDVVVCDFAMAVMDGIAFTSTVRSHPSLHQTPIVLVSARDDETVRARGVEAGADGFLSKGDCAAGRLLALVSQVVTRRGASEAVPEGGAGA